jgi:hypothetical protein
MKGLKELDRVLRCEANRTADGERGPNVALLPLLTANLLLAASYGVCMGIFGVSGRPEPEFRQTIADAVKVPLLFLLTLAVTFPSLYVFNALVGSRLGVWDLARLMTAGLGVLLAVLAAFGPIVGFFSVTTSSYPFVVLMNVAVFTLSAAFGLSYLIRTLNHILPRPMAARPAPRVNPDIDIEAIPAREPPVAETEAPTTRSSAAQTVLYVWLAVFALVGAQMSWVLRPFIGSPTEEFTWFRPREASFFEAVVRSMRMLFGG